MLAPLATFESLETHHCVTGSMRHIYTFYNHPISEEMLFGLGEGTGYIYWHQRGQTPFLGGRASPEPSVEELAGQRTGVQLTPHTTSSARKAETALLALLERGIPVMLQVDMGFLPYMDFGGEEYHFGGHVIVACGYDAETGTVLVADRDRELHPVPLEALAQARGSQHKPFPPKHKWYTCDFSGKRQPTAPEICTAITNQAQLMLNPPISNIGIAGIRKTAQLLPKWRGTLNEVDLRTTLFNAYIFISPVGGTGGGAFRYMFSRFLSEAAGLIGDNVLHQAAQDFQDIGDRWAALGGWCQQLAAAPSPGDYLDEAVEPLREIATLEELAWTRLASVADQAS
ncbi:MAG: BtrH N-terminal domain-containing protein [Chloroflexota bacterium]